MISISTNQHRGKVVLRLTVKAGSLLKRFNVVEVLLLPEIARTVGIALIEDAAAADCYAHEIADAATLDKERLGE